MIGLKSCVSFSITALPRTLMHVSAASPGGRPPGNPRGTHGLGRGFAAKIFPGDRGTSAFAFLAKLPGDLPTRFANALLSRGPDSVAWQGVANPLSSAVPRFSGKFIK